MDRDAVLDRSPSKPIITDDAKVLCVARADGRIRWTTQLDSYSNPESRKGPIAWAGPVLVSDRLIAVSSE